MKALTLYQPWATLVAIGAKRVETRSWSTSYRGQLAIHVSKNKQTDWPMILTEPFRTALQNHLIHYLSDNHFRFLPKNLNLGCVIAVCNLIDVQPSGIFDHYKQRVDPRFGSAYWQCAGKVWPMNDQELAFGDYSPGRYLFFLDDVKLLPVPILARGAMRLWEWEDQNG